jgi:hypothetical protein
LSLISVSYSPVACSIPAKSLSTNSSSCISSTPTSEASRNPERQELTHPAPLTQPTHPTATLDTQTASALSSYPPIGTSPTHPTLASLFAQSPIPGSCAPRTESPGHISSAMSPTRVTRRTCGTAASSRPPARHTRTPPT